MLRLRLSALFMCIFFFPLEEAIFVSFGIFMAYTNCAIIPDNLI